eukprot:6119399-Heterocapsa_arctica.AAC.1
MSTRTAARALEAAEKQLQESLQDLDEVAGMLGDLEEEIAAALRAEEERKCSAARAREELEEGLARTLDSGPAQEGDEERRPRPP